MDLPPRKKTTVGRFLEQKEYAGFNKLYLLFLTYNPVRLNELNKQTIRRGCIYKGVEKDKLLNNIKSANVPVKEKVLQLLQKEMLRRAPI